MKTECLYLVLIASITCFRLIGQDVAICGFNYDNNDGYTLVALVDIPSTQHIFVTDSPYQPASNSFDGSGTVNESTVRITWTGTWTKGTIIEVEETASNVLTATSSTNGPASPAATISYAGDGFSQSNEGFSVFNASDPADPDNAVTEIYSYVVYDKATSADPDPSDDADCPCSADFVSVDLGGATIDHGQYRPSLRSNGISLADYNNAANWDNATVNVNLSLVEFTNLTFGGSGLLPVELISFSAHLQDNNVLLEWRTASELNNDYFQIEHSRDGQLFQIVGQVNGNGTSGDRHDYSFSHSPLLSGAQYYRLKQVDFGGSFEYSDIAVVDIKSTSDVFYISPNPFVEAVTLRLPETNVASGSPSTIQILDMSSKTVFQETIPNTLLEHQLDLSALGSGAYVLRYTGHDGVESSQRIIKK